MPPLAVSAGAGSYVALRAQLSTSVRPVPTSVTVTTASVSQVADDALEPVYELDALADAPDPLMDQLHGELPPMVQLYVYAPLPPDTEIPRPENEAVLPGNGTVTELGEGQVIVPDKAVTG